MGMPHTLNGTGFICFVLALLSSLLGVGLTKLAAAMEAAMCKGEDFFGTSGPRPDQVAPEDNWDKGSAASSPGPSSPACSPPGTAPGVSRSVAEEVRREEQQRKAQATQGAGQDSGQGSPSIVKAPVSPGSRPTSE